MRYIQPKRKRVRINKVRLTISIIIVLLLVGGILALAIVLFPPSAKKSPAATHTNSDNKVSEPKAPEVKVKKGEGLTLLVNANLPLPKDYPEPDIVSLMDVVAARDADVSVSKEIVKPLKKMLDAAVAAGGEGLIVTSGYRNRASQKAIYESAEDKSYVQPPGCSEHQTGLAVDIAKNGLDMHHINQDPAGKWLYDNSWKYGFIVRYPENKVDITGISYEPWHFRYVGKKVAKICHSEDLCLEEYIEKYT